MRSTDRAARLMQQFGVDDSLIGDVLEQCRAGQSAVGSGVRPSLRWHGGSLSACGSSSFQVAARTWESVWLATGAVAMSLLALVSLDAPHLEVSCHPGRRVVSVGHELDGTIVAACDWQLFVLLHPWAWTWTVAWCAVLCANRVVLSFASKPISATRY